MSFNMPSAFIILSPILGFVREGIYNLGIVHV